MPDMRRLFGIVGLVAAVLTLIGSLLPWATVYTAFGSVSKAGTDGDGILTLLAAVAAGGLLAGALWGTYRRALPVIAACCGGVAVLVAAVDLADVSSRVSDANATAGGFAHASVGGGLVLTAIGAVAVTIAAVLMAAGAPSQGRAAQSLRFNPPPGWPPPPANFRPGKNWIPDPSWPPAPEGWQWWLSEDGGPVSRANAPWAHPSVR